MSLAKMKREMIIGSRWVAFHHGWNGIGGKDMGERSVCRVQSNAVAFRKPDGVGESWLHFPPAIKIKTSGGSTFIVLGDDDKPLLTYRKVS